MKRLFVIKSEQIRLSAIVFLREIPLEPHHEVIIREHRSQRNSEQNRKMWAMLTDVSKQVEWYGRMLSPEDWKCIFTAALKKVDVVPNLEGDGFVAIGLYTHKMSVKAMADLITLIYAFGNEKKVKWSEPIYGLDQA